MIEFMHILVAFLSYSVYSSNVEYRVGTQKLRDTLTAWDEVIPGRGKIHLIACGGTALTLMGYKESTKDVDFLIPDLREYQRLLNFLKQAGYRQTTSYGWKRPEESILFDFYAGNRIYSTELLTSPLKRGGNKKINEWKKIYLGVLNPIDLIISKMFRGSEADLEDSLALLRNEKINLEKLKKRYKETAKYDVAEERVLRNLNALLNKITKGRKR